MLVLSRKLGESVMIDGQVEVTIVALEGNRVRLGINAPRDIPVLRGELEPHDHSSHFSKNISPQRK